MDFQEADRRYAELKAQYNAGTLSADQMDAQLKEMMVQDEKGQWWAKSRDSGDWSYYDGANWVRATPPGFGMGQPTTNVSGGLGSTEVFAPSSAAGQGYNPGRQMDQGMQAGMPQGGQPGPMGMGQAPGQGYNPPVQGYSPPAQGAAGQQGYGQYTPPPQGGYNPQAGYGQAPPPMGGYAQGQAGSLADKPVDSGLAVVFYLLSFFVPIAALILYLIYRSKPFATDKQLANRCGIIGLVSFGLYFVCFCALPLLSTLGGTRY